MICPECGRRYSEGRTKCPDDGATLLDMGVQGRSSGGNRTPSRGPRPPSAPLPPPPAPRRTHSGPVVMRPIGSGPMIGTTVAGRYVIEEKVGSGGMGVVYRARQLLVDRAVALKILPRDLADDPAAAKRFTNEAKAISQLRHPHIVTLYDFGTTEDGRPFIAMEFVHGRTLSEVIKAGPIKPGAAVAIARQVLEALQAAHDMGIIHRDIKADNVMIEARTIGADQVRVLDFGIARTVDTDPRLTQTGIVYATPQYCSPEQALAQPLDHRTDLYSLGVLFFELLAGRLPFIEKLGPLLLHKHINEPAPRLAEVVPERQISPALDALVHSLLAKDPARRPASARAVLDTLAQIEQAMSQPAAIVLPMAMDTDALAAAALSPSEPASAELNGEQEVSPVTAPSGHSRMALWLALGIGTVAAAGAIWMVFLSDSADETMTRRPEPAIAAALLPQETPATPPSLASAPVTTAPAPPSEPALDLRLKAGLRGFLLPPPIPAGLMSDDPDAPVPPPPANTLPGTLGARWAEVNARYAQARARYDEDVARYLTAADQGAPAPVEPTPLYAPLGAELEALLAAEPKPAHRDVALYYAGHAALSGGERPKAMQHFEALVRDFPQSNLSSLVGRVFADHAFFDKRDAALARKGYAQVAGRAKGHERLYARFMLGYACYNDKALPEAIEALKAVLSDPLLAGPATEKYTEAATGALVLALSRVEGGVDRAADYFGGRGKAREALSLMARLQEADENLDAAFATWQRVLRDAADASPEEAVRLLREADGVVQRRKDPAGAIAHYESVLSAPAGKALPAGMRLLMTARLGAAMLATGRTLEGASLLGRVEGESAGLPDDPVAAEARAMALLHATGPKVEALEKIDLSRATASEQQANDLRRDILAQAAAIDAQLEAVGSLGPAEWKARAQDTRRQLATAVAGLLGKLAATPPAELDAAGAARYVQSLKDEIARQTARAGR